MKRKLLAAAAAAALALTAALPAAAQGYRDYRRQPGYHPPVITVHTDRGTIVAHRGERLYYALKRGPYEFKDGRIYTYGDCYRGRCDVRVYDPNWTTRRTNWIVAPPVDRLFARGYGRFDQGRWGR